MIIAIKEDNRFLFFTTKGILSLPGYYKELSEETLPFFKPARQKKLVGMKGIGIERSIAAVNPSIWNSDITYSGAREMGYCLYKACEEYHQCYAKDKRLHMEALVAEKDRCFLITRELEVYEVLESHVLEDEGENVPMVSYLMEKYRELPAFERIRRVLHDYSIWCRTAESTIYYMDSLECKLHKL